MRIIKLQKSDIKLALKLIWTVFKEFDAPDYSKQGIKEFRNFISYKSIIKKYENGKLHFWGCKKDGHLIGVISTKEVNHICMLFVKKQYHRQGIARSLFQKVEEVCKNLDDLSEITINSSPFAIEVYHHLGFVNTGNEQIINGIRFTPMSYSLK